jgi:DNA-nicking Smr family endonuclease
MPRKRSKNFKELSGNELLPWIEAEEDDADDEIIPAPTITPHKQKNLPVLSADSMLGSDKATFEKLKKGRFKIEARLDLHGLTLNSAYEAVRQFLGNCSARGMKCVVIITGKGRGGSGTINSELPSWLNSPELRGKIISFTHAAAKDGGRGAFYILIRQN